MMNYPINITFTLGGLFKTIYTVAGLMILTYVFLVLKNIYLILKNYNEVLGKNIENLDSLIKDSTEILHRVNNITEKVPESAMNMFGGLKDSMSMAQTALSLLFGLSKKNKDN